ncbi:hypothetical protein E8E11_010154 [Didymella keratinophila]|nr:hypothetical protein E8E11_010154 [Didymella keratinophila]
MARTKRIEPEPRALDPVPAGTRAILRPVQKAVAYHIPVFPSTDDGTPLRSTIALPLHSAWTSGLHFHATHTEYLRLVKGAAFVELNGKTRFISALAGGEVDSTDQLVAPGLIIRVPRYAFHNWGRLQHYKASARSGRTVQKDVLPEDWTEEVVVEEWTDPSDITKPLFFWNLNGIITTPDGTILSKRQAVAKALLGSLWIDLQLFVVFWELDNWPVFNVLRHVSPATDSYLRTLRVPEAAEMLISFGILLIGKLFGVLLGLKAVEERRTPDALWEAYTTSQSGQPSRDL